MSTKRIWRPSLLAIAALLLGLIEPTECVAQHFRVPSQAMAPTICPGETIWAAPVEPEDVRVGDVVIYDVEEGDRVIPFVKRVLALPGQRIAFRDGVPIIDGQPATRLNLGPEEVAFQNFADGYFLHLRRYREVWEGVRYETFYEDETPLPPNPTWGQVYSRDALLSSPLRQMDEVIVPPGHFFAVGDYRDDSNDSRQMGPAPLSSIRSRVEFIALSADPGRIGRRLRPDNE